jgi:AraC-like DNA-binding protein
MEKKILLVEISSVDKKPLVSSLYAMGYTPVEITLAEINATLALPISREKLENSCLMIVDAKNGHGQDIIKAVINAQKNLVSDTALDLPIVALIGSNKSNKHLMYDQGAFDYISSPLIPAELSLRITYAADTFAATQASLQAVLKPIASPLFSQEYASILAESTAHYLKSRLHEDINFAVLTIEMCANRNKINEAFKVFYGITVFAWLHEKRMEMAEILLKTTTLTVLEVGDRVGYSDSNNFSTAFKREYKLSPRHYRQSLS